MDINEFVEKFAEQFEDTDPAEIQADTAFKELEEWSSLMALTIIAMVDEEYQVSLKGDDIRNSITVKDLYNCVNAKI